MESTKSVLPIIILIFALTIGATMIAKGLDRHAVMSAWSERRCEVPIMMAAPLFKPADDPRSYAEFSAANFEFCMKDIQSKSLRSALEPMMSLFKGQVAASDTLANSTNNLRTIMGRVVNDTTGILLGTFYEQFKKYAYAASSVTQRMKMAFDRITASTQAMLYMAISTIRAILNGIDFILLVAVIIVTILAILFIILFFVLFPSVPLILAVISILVAAGVEVGSLRNTFCFAPQTRIKLRDSTLMPVASLRVGDHLLGGGTVTGMYTFDGTETPLFDVSGIHVAGDHMMLDPSTNKWLYVKDYAAAVPGISPYRRLYCPVVDNRILIVESDSGEMTFRDWEEVDTVDGVNEWERWVWNELNPGVAAVAAVPGPLGFNHHVTVNTLHHGRVSIRDVKIGDYVSDGSPLSKATKATKVIGIYNGIIGPDVTYTGNWSLCEDGIWRRDSMPAQPGNVYHLITESGTFRVNRSEDDVVLVRDATEVGYKRIGESYDTILRTI